MEINEWCESCHRIAKKKGFWDVDKNVPEYLMLVVGEISEAVEAHRNGDIDKMKEEIADVFIRLFDFCGRHNIDIESEIDAKHLINMTRKVLHGKKY